MYCVPPECWQAWLSKISFSFHNNICLFTISSKYWSPDSLCINLFCFTYLHSVLWVPKLSSSLSSYCNLGNITHWLKQFLWIKLYRWNCSVAVDGFHSTNDTSQYGLVFHRIVLIYTVDPTVLCASALSIYISQNL